MQNEKKPVTKARKPQVPTQCTVPWEQMANLSGGRKYCSACDKEIHPVRTKAEFDQAMLEEKCVWFDRGTDAPPKEFGMVHKVMRVRPLPPGWVGGAGTPRGLKGGAPLVWID